MLDFRGRVGGGGLGLGVHEVERDRAPPAQLDDALEVERLADGASVHAPDALADLDAEARHRRACVDVTREKTPSTDATRGEKKRTPHNHQE